MKVELNMSQFREIITLVLPSISKKDLETLCDDFKDSKITATATLRRKRKRAKA